MASAAKEFKELRQEADKQGWKAKKIKMGWMLLAPDGVNKVTTHGTPGDRRALDNIVSEMRHFGFVWRGH